MMMLIPFLRYYIYQDCSIFVDLFYREQTIVDLFSIIRAFSNSFLNILTPLSRTYLGGPRILVLRISRGLFQYPPFKHFKEVQKLIFNFCIIILCNENYNQSSRPWVVNILGLGYLTHKPQFQKCTTLKEIVLCVRGGGEWRNSSEFERFKQGCKVWGNHVFYLNNTTF